MNGKEYTLEDDFLNQRFDPKYKQIFKEKIESLDETSIPRSFSVPVKFLGLFDKKTEIALSSIVNRVLINAGIHGLTLRKSNPIVQFFTLTAWFDKQHKKSDINLPASIIKWQGSQPIIQLIIPNEINSLEMLINIARLLFSKLFGTLFFNENVLQRKPFKAATETKNEVDFGVTEKFHISRLLDDYLISTKEKIKRLAPHGKLNNQKSWEIGKKELFRRIESGMYHDIDRPILELLEEIFLFHYKSAQEKPIDFYNLTAEKVFIMLPKIGFILPHEERLFNSLKIKKQWELFDSIGEKAQFVKNCINDLIECLEYIETHHYETESDFTTIEYWINVLNSRIVFLKRKGLVKLFLIEDSRLTLNQEKDKCDFPLWIWRHRIFENYPKNVPSDKVLASITNQYKLSIYQKILEASFRAISCLKIKRKVSNPELLRTKDYSRLKSIVAGLRVRLPFIEDIIYTGRISSQMVKKNNDDRELRKIIKDFENGWSYFISFALIHQYYLAKRATTEDKAAIFLKIIQNHIENKLDQQNSLQISYLFLQLYLKQQYNLNDVIRIIKNGSETFHFFLFNFDKIVKKNAPLHIIIKSYSENILKQ